MVDISVLFPYRQWVLYMHLQLSIFFKNIGGTLLSLFESKGVLTKIVTTPGCNL